MRLRCDAVALRRPTSSGSATAGSASCRSPGGGAPHGGGLAGPARQAVATYPVTRERLRGYAEALGAAGVDWTTVPVYEGTTSSPEQGRAGAEVLLSLEP